MPSISDVHNQFKLKLDRVASLSNPDFFPEEIDVFLNEAQLLFIKQRMGMNNTKKKGFETSQKRIDDLSSLVVKYPLQPAVVPSSPASGVYEVDLSTLDYPYLYLINAYTKVKTADDCYLTIPLKYTQHDDFNESIRDPFNKESKEFIPFNYGRSATGGTSMYIYSTQDVEEVFIEYIKKPSSVALGTYPNADGSITPPTTFETPDPTH